VDVVDAALAEALALPQAVSNLHWLTSRLVAADAAVADVAVAVPLRMVRRLDFQTAP
jgi:hypothetical protein